jgi:hypothetical protein
LILNNPSITQLDDISVGILMQGRISEWTSDIIKEYENNFPNAQIIISTWINEDTSDITCEVIKTQLPKPVEPFGSTINHQIVGAQLGLEKMKSTVVMKCRTDQFIHNSNIFKLFLESCMKNKIMVMGMDKNDKRDYLINDLCQIAYKEVLTEYWNSMPLYDGSYSISPEVYFPKNYIQNIKKDSGIWSTVKEKYYCIKDDRLDFKLEFEKYMKFESYQKTYLRYFYHNR